MSERWSKTGALLWGEAVPITTTLGEVYLNSRGIFASFGPDVLRFHPAAAHPKLKTKMPALIAKVNRSAEPAFGLTFLAPDGKAKASIDRKEQRRTLGSNKGGAAHLGEPQPGKPLLIGEGFETVATAVEATGLPGWATLGAALLSGVKLPDGVTEIIHLAENDGGPNQKALDKACPVLAERGVKNRIAAPPARYKDFNDVVKGDGAERNASLMLVKMMIESAGDWQPKKTKVKEEPDPSDGQFLLDETGLHRRKDRKWNWLAQSFEVLGQARDAAVDGDVAAGWGKLVRFKNPDGKLCEEIVTNALLHGDLSGLIGQLVSHGMKIKGTISARLSLVEYLISADAEQRVTVAHSTGWVAIGKQLAFVLPSEIISATGVDERVILAGRVHAPYDWRGALESWRDVIAAPAADHRMLRFAIATAFCGPLLFLGNFESGLVHLHGPSSVGKTTLLKVAASVWGSGADGGYVRSWRTTANALEATLASVCDTLLLLDELGQADGREIGAVIYMIAGAIGKARMSRDAGLKVLHKWRTMGLSTGETPIAFRLGEDQKIKRAHAGQLVRAIDVPARREMGVFDRSYVDFDPKAFADEMKLASATYYGTAGPAFVRGLIERHIGGEEVRKLVDAFVADALAGVTDNHGQAVRVAERFGLIAAAGRLAAEFGLVAWSKDQPAKDALALFKAWLAARGGAAPVELRQMIEQVRHFLEAHGDARFDDLDPLPINPVTLLKIERRPVINRAGYRRGEGDNRRWLVLPQVWSQEICAGFDPRDVAKVLIDRGMMEPGEDGKHSQNVRLPNSEKTQRFYVLTPAIFEGWGDENEK
jgi:uncharacterized protein (DUF927 family)